MKWGVRLTQNNYRPDRHCLPSISASTCGRAPKKGRLDGHNIVSERTMYTYIFLHHFLIYSISNSFSLIFILYSLFLWAIKHSLRVLLYFPVVKLILVIYPIKFILKMTNNIQDITFHTLMQFSTFHALHIILIVTWNLNSFEIILRHNLT